MSTSFSHQNKNIPPQWEQYYLYYTSEKTGTLTSLFIALTFENYERYFFMKF